MILNGHLCEYIDEIHTYLIDGVIVPSVTQILKVKFEGKYKYVNSDLLSKAAEYGTEVHKEIEDYCKKGIISSDKKELKNFIFLKKIYNFDVIENEVPVLLYYKEKPVAMGRLDLVLKMDDMIGGADIKCTSALDKEYVTYQLNLYRIAYRQTYGIDWKFLKAVHLKNDKRKLVNLPINENMALNLLKKYMEVNK